MRYYLQDDADGRNLRRVSEAQDAPSAEQLGIDLATAIEVSRPPREFEIFDAETATWALDAIRMDAALHAKIDATADAASPTWRPEYAQKASLARALVAGDIVEAADIVDEAKLRKLTVPDMAALIIVRADADDRARRALAKARIAAKLAISAATTRAAKLAAADVDFEALLAPGQE